MGYDLKWVVPSTPEEDAEEWRSYWRESAWTMGNFRALLHHVEMMDYEATEAPDDDGDLGASDTGPIKVYKLVSNEQYIVSEAQCLEILDNLVDALFDDAGALIQSYADGELFEVHDYTREVAVAAAMMASRGGTEIVKGPPDDEPAINKGQAIAAIPAIAGFIHGASQHGGFVVT